MRSLPLFLLILLLAACGTTLDGEEQGTEPPPNGEQPNGEDPNGDEPHCEEPIGGDPEPDPEFDPDEPGVHMFFTLGSMLMMGDTMSIGVGGFQPTAREDFEPYEEGPRIALGSCIEATDFEPTPQCSSQSDCAPEQECKPRTNDNNEPIPGTESCVTSRELLDVGPFTMTGFNGGSQSFQYNPGQNGAYTTADPGDGQLPPGVIAFETTYTFEGQGDPAMGLGPFSGELQVGPNLQLTSHTATPDGMGLPAIEIDANAELLLEWTGQTDGEIEITLSGASMLGGGGTVICRAPDTGSFTIPQAMVQAAELGSMAFLNNLTMERKSAGWARGEGLTFHEIEMMHTLMLNVTQ